MLKVRKAIVPIAGLGTRFLPLSKVLPKELFPLVDKPVLQYIVEEVLASGIKEIVFVNQPEKKIVLNYFKKYFRRFPELEEILKTRKKNHLLKELKIIEKLKENLSFSQVLQKEPFGSSHAVLQAKKLIKNEPCAVLYGDDIVESKVPCLLQLIKIFKIYQKPVMAIYRLPKEKLPSYGVVEVKKIAPRLYQIKNAVEKPRIGEAPSNLAVVGKYIITPEVFNYLQKTNFSIKSDITVTETLAEMAREGEEIYGYEFEGRWLECGNKPAWLESNLYLSLKHPQFGKELRKFLKKI